MLLIDPAARGLNDGDSVESAVGLRRVAIERKNGSERPNRPNAKPGTDGAPRDQIIAKREHCYYYSTCTSYVVRSYLEAYYVVPTNVHAPT